MKFAKLCGIGLAVVAASLLHFPAFAQSNAEADNQKTHFQNLFGKAGDAQTFRIATDFPSSPAFAVIDEDPTPLQNIRNFEDFGLQLNSGIDSDGSLKGQGLSFGGRPFWWGDRSDLTITEYSATDNYLGRLYQRTHFSVATIKQDLEGSNSVWRAGVALTTELLDQQDIRYVRPNADGSLPGDFGKCMSEKGATFAALVENADKEAIRKAVKIVKDTYPNLDLSDVNGDDGQLKDPAGVLAAIIAASVGNASPTAVAKVYNDARLASYAPVDNALADKAQTECVALRDRDLQKQPSLRVGIAHGLTSTTGKVGDFEGEAVSVWVSGRYPTQGFIPGSTLNGFLQSDTSRLLKYETPGAPAGVVVDGLAKGDRLQASIGLAVMNDDLTLAGSAAYVDIDFNNPALIDDDYTLISFTASQRIAKGIWLELNIGSSDSSRLNDSEYVNLRFKFDWSQLNF